MSLLLFRDQHSEKVGRDQIMEIVSGMLNNLALDIPQKSIEKSRRTSNAKSQAKKRENETDIQKQARHDKEAKAQALKRSAMTSEEKRAYQIADANCHYHRRKEDRKIVTPWLKRSREEKNDAFKDEHEERIVKDWLHRMDKQADRSQKRRDSMSEEQKETLRLQDRERKEEKKLRHMTDEEKVNYKKQQAQKALDREEKKKFEERKCRTMTWEAFYRFTRPSSSHPQAANTIFNKDGICEQK